MDWGFLTKNKAEHSRRHRSHDFEIELFDQRPSIDGWSKRAEDAYPVSNVRPLLFSKRNKSLSGSLRVANQADFFKARLF